MPNELAEKTLKYVVSLISGPWGTIIISPCFIIENRVTIHLLANVDLP